MQIAHLHLSLVTPCWLKGKVSTKTVLVMKLTAILLLTMVLQGSARTIAQTVTYSGRMVPIPRVLTAFKDQTGYRFFYRNEDLQDAGLVTVDFKNTPLKMALNEMFGGLLYEYEIQGNTIFISKKPAPKPQPDKVFMDAIGLTIEMPGDVRGIVRDEKNNPLPGVTVFARTTRTVMVTGPEGDFVFRNLNDGDTLQFSSINYELQAARVSTRSLMIIYMKPKVARLESVTVYNTGFQTLSKERATGSFSKPDMEVFTKRTGTMDLIGRLEGQIAGLQIAGNASSYTANTNGNGVTTKKSLIRGVTSVSLGTEPLYVVNGVIIAEFSSVNVDDIEDITVLKDAAAASIWGARAANGVIVITTKTGNKNQRMSISYSGFVNYTGRPDFSYGKAMNSQQFIQTAKETFDPVANPWSSVATSGLAPHEQILYDQNRGIISAATANQKLDSLASINGLGQISDLFYRPTISTNHSISASGGNNVYSFYGSLGYTGTQSATPGERNNSYKLNLTQSITAGTRMKLTVSASVINTVSSKQNMPGVTPNFLPYQLFQDATGKGITMNYLTGYSDSVRQNYQSRSRINLDYNPMNEISQGSSNSNNLSINVTANAMVKLWKGFSFVGTYGYQKAPGTAIYYSDSKLLSQRKQIISLTVAPTIGSTPVYNFPLNGGNYQTGTNDQRNWTVRNQLAYDGTLRRGRDHLTVQVGNDVQEGYQDRTSTTLYGYDQNLGTYAILDYAKLRSGISGTVTGFGSLFANPYSISKTTSRFISYFALGSYSIDNKYSFDASVRQDYSNQLGKNLSKQSKPSWSFGARWQLNKEKFLQTATWLNNLSLRATHGILGNSPYVGAASLTDVFSSVASSNNSNAIAGDALTLSNVANTSLSWEVTHVTNIGIDFTVLNQRFGGGIDVYQKNTTDLIGSVQLNPWTGRTSLTGNIGKLVNRGIEITLRSENIRGKDFSWSTSANFSYNYNKLVSYSKPSPFLNTASSRVGGSGAVVGYNTSALFAYQFAGLDNIGDPQIYLADKTVTKSPNIAQLGDVVYAGITRPTMFGGMTNNFNYKGLSLSLNAIYTFGAVMRKDVASSLSGRILYTSTSFGGPNIQTYIMDRWRKPGDEAITNIPSYVASSAGFTRRNLSYYTQGDINVVSADYIKLRDVTLSYNLPASALQFLKIQRANVFVQTTNFMLWKANHEGIDPEVSRSAATGYPGHSYSFGVNLSL
jgi:TonB-linked SusC/RagA family outer membrane protein